MVVRLKWKLFMCIFVVQQCSELVIICNMQGWLRLRVLLVLELLMQQWCWLGIRWQYEVLLMLCMYRVGFSLLFFVVWLQIMLRISFSLVLWRCVIIFLNLLIWLLVRQVGCGVKKVMLLQFQQLFMLFFSRCLLLMKLWIGSSLMLVILSWWMCVSRLVFISLVKVL